MRELIGTFIQYAWARGDLCVILDTLPASSPTPQKLSGYRTVIHCLTAVFFSVSPLRLDPGL